MRYYRAGEALGSLERVGGAVTTGTATMARHGRKPEVAFLVLLVIVGSWLRFYRIDASLWFDEIVTLLDSVRPTLGTIVTTFPGNNDHPLYSVLAHIAVSVFGESPGVLRLPAALFGILSIPLLYVVGTAVTNRREAGAAALVLTVSYHHVWFSQNARGYTIVLFCTLLSTLALVRWSQGERTSWLYVYSVATAAGAYAHLTMVLVAGSQALACVFDMWWHPDSSRMRAEWKPLAGAFAGAALLTVACYAPMLGDVGAFFIAREGASDTVATPLWSVLAALRGLQTGFGGPWAIALGAVVFGAGAWSYLVQRPTVALLLLLAVPVTLLAVLVTGNPVRPRFVFFGIGFGLLVAMRGAAVLGALAPRLIGGRMTAERAATLAVTVMAIGAVVLSVRSLPYGYRFPKQDYEGAIELVERSRGETDRVVAIGETAAIPIQQYFGRPWQRVDDVAQLREARQGDTRVWAVYTFPSYIEAGRPELWRMLQEECTMIRDFTGTVEGATVSVRACPPVTDSGPV